MLKYLFTATYKDGTVFRQDSDDKSTIEPEKRSAFFDALKLAEEKSMVRFMLTEQGAIGRFPNQYAVDLKDGHFEINGVPFFMHNKPVEDLEVVFFRNHTHTYTQSATGASGVEGGPSMRETGHEIVYCIGWKEKGVGKGLEYVMKFK